MGRKSQFLANINFGKIIFLCVSSKMVRTYNRRKPKRDAALMALAIEEIKSGHSVHGVAKKYEIPRGTLRCRMKMNVNKSKDPQCSKRVCD